MKMGSPNKPEEYSSGKDNQDMHFESFIRNLNDYLAPFEERQYLDLEETLPSVHVIGVPRSGTTMMTQLICSYLDVGYINNLVARFWKAPVTAIHISRKLLNEQHESSLSSRYGKTQHINEPHEFNYFWTDLLDYADFKVKSAEEAKTMNWERVAHSLKNIIHAFGKPVAFKSFVMGWHASLMQQYLTKTCFVWIRRNPIDNALSLLETRENHFGSRYNWSTLKPQNYESLKSGTPHEQIAAQVYYMEQTYQEQLERLPKANYQIFQYEEVCKDPAPALEAVKNMLNKHNGNVTLRDYELPQLEPSIRSRDKSEDYKKTMNALQSFYPSAPGNKT